MPAIALLLLLIIIIAAVVAPLIPMRRRRGAGVFPYVTVALVCANVVLFAGFSHDGSLPPDFERHFGLIPRQATLLALFTHMFLHGSWMHLLGNMFCLWLFGPYVEEALGRREYLLFYLGSGFAGGLAHILISLAFLPAAAHLPLVGASGAIFGVMGLFAIRFWRTKVRVFLFARVNAIWAIGVFGGLQIVYGIVSFADGGASDNTANWAHVGGFLFGVMMAGLLRLREDSRREYRLEDAEVAVKKGNLDRGAAAYRETLEETPDDAESHLALARICVRQRQGEAAHRHYNDALRLLLKNDDAAVVPVYEEATTQFQVFPLPANLLQRIASACENTQRHTLAQRALTDLCRDYPDAREAEMGLLRLGKLHLQKLNQPQSAEGIFHEFLRLYPHSEWHNHVETLLREAQLASAIFPR